MNELSIKEAQDFLDSIPNINSGGCGIAALALKRICDKLKEETFGFSLLFCPDDLGTFNRHWTEIALDNGDYDEVSPGHVALNMKFDLVDSGGVVLDGIYDYEIVVDEPTLVKCIKEGNWNDEFPRAEYIPIIEKRLSIDLGDIK